jgi:hypothetical protein
MRHACGEFDPSSSGSKQFRQRYERIHGLPARAFLTIGADANDSLPIDCKSLCLTLWDFANVHRRKDKTKYDKNNELWQCRRPPAQLLVSPDHI